jgi:hypothetical protein
MQGAIGMQSKARLPLTIRIDLDLRDRLRRGPDRDRRTIGAEIMALVDDTLAARSIVHPNGF